MVPGMNKYIDTLKRYVAENSPNYVSDIHTIPEIAMRLKPR